MATNPPSGDGHRNGAVKDRSQTFNPVTKQWVKRDSDTGRFMDVKKDGTPFKGVRKENPETGERGGVSRPANPAFTDISERRQPWTNPYI